MFRHELSIIPSSSRMPSKEPRFVGPRACPGSLLQPMTAGRLKDMISNVRRTLDMTSLLERVALLFVVPLALTTQRSLNRGTVTPLEPRGQLEL